LGLPPHPQGNFRQQVSTMYRGLLILGLAASANVAFASETSEAGAEAPVCIKSEPEAKAAVGGDTSATAARPGEPAPVRPRQSVRGTPRWNSLLPGMIR
jgi:hypothetical protein